MLSKVISRSFLSLQEQLPHLPRHAAAATAAPVVTREDVAVPVAHANARAVTAGHGEDSAGDLRFPVKIASNPDGREQFGAVLAHPLAGFWLSTDRHRA